MLFCKDVEGKACLSACALGSAFGVMKGVWLMFLAWGGAVYGYTSPMMEHMYHFYKGYGPSFVGGIVGGIYGFICGFIFGAVVAILYNFFLCSGKKSKAK